MSVSFTVPFVTIGYGLKDEDLDEIIRMERLNDISQVFSESIEFINNRFESKTRIRIIEFSEISGVDIDSNEWFRSLVSAQRHLFYSHLHSNKDSCVLFKYAGLNFDRELFEKRLLPHEFAHHYQWESQNFPCLVPKGAPNYYLPQFTKAFEVGPGKGSVYIDNALLIQVPQIVVKDFCERVSDSVCEGILREKGFEEGIMDEYVEQGKHDPAKDYLPQVRAGPEDAILVRYVRRLFLLDEAEWNVLLSQAFPKNQALKSRLRNATKLVMKLNKKYIKAKHVFNRVHDVIQETDYRSFKKPEKAVNYIKQVMKLLNVEIRTTESW